MTKAMIIITNCEKIRLEDYECVVFDFDRAMVGFQIMNHRKELYFQSAGAAKEFVQEIIEGIYNKQIQLDLSHFPVVPSRLNISETIIEIQSRLKK